MIFQNNILSVRELQQNDINSVLDYWYKAEENYLLGMGVDIKKLPSREVFKLMLQEQINTPIEQKKAYCIIWQQNGNPIGHSNTNPTKYGDEATMHLHLWDPDVRKKGMGTTFLKMTLNLFFENLQLKKLYCEPYALNPAPHKTLEKTGFTFVKKYMTTPGSINFEQPVMRWVMSRENFLRQKGK